MDELLADFLTECSENMTELDLELVKLERNPNDLEPLGGIFRMVHTIKGTCGFLGLPRLETVAHAAENVLGMFREGAVPVTPQAVNVVLEALDRIKEILDGLAATGHEPVGDDADLIAALNAFVEGGSGAEVETAADEPFEPVPAAPGFETAAEGAGLEPASATPMSAAAVAEEVKAAHSAPAQSLRVPVDLLESLMTLVGELVLTRNQLLQLERQSSDSALKAPMQRLSHITSELQEGVMKTRMQPIGNAWSKLPRIVRDLARDLDKKIDLRMHGAETELDRQVLELIKDPLTHMVRNSADHGLETPDVRRDAGKPEQGVIDLRAFHEGGHIIIQISDDGKGLDVEKLKEKAVANKLCTAEEAAGLSKQQIMQFIFKAGFSTAAAVTNVSGRGVGMDVVRTNIEKIGGSIELSSELGKGSTFTIKIPLTLAIVSALIVAAGGERFAVPQISVIELVRAGAGCEHKIETIDGSSILRLRDQLLPLLPLGHILRLPDAQPIDPNGAYVVVTRIGPLTFGLVVDQVYDTEEIVVKPVAPILRGLGMFSGNTILGDGNVVMILDANGLASAFSHAGNQTEDDAKARINKDDEVTSLLLFEAGGGSPKAVPLALVTRLEEITLDQIEWSDGRTIVQYRGGLMPLTDIHGAPVELRPGESRPVLVFSDVEHNMGLAVDRILDIDATVVDLKMESRSSSTLGTAVVAGRSTDMLDVSHFVNEVFGGWFTRVETEPFADSPARPRVLLVDDSSFFRNMLKPLLISSGYRVETAACPAQALELREQGERFDLIVSDIEMPGMDGFAFAAACRAGGIWQKVPMVALTSHATDKDRERGRKVGFNGHVGKLDRGALNEALTAALATA